METTTTETVPRRSFGRFLVDDFRASLVVFLVALPLSLGIAVASGVPPALALITAIVGGIVVGALPGSTYVVSGPAAGLTVLVYELVDSHGIEALGPVVLLAGMMQVGLAFLRLGHWFRAVSLPVIQGMLAAIGILIIFSQIYVLVDDGPHGNAIENLLFLPEAFTEGAVPEGDHHHNFAALIGLMTIAIMVAWGRVPRVLRGIPAPLVGVGVATAVTAIFALPIKHVEIEGSLLSNVSLPSLGTVSEIGLVPIFAAGLMFALIASAESLLSAAAVDRMVPHARTNYNRELLAQGVGNSTVGFLGALPMTGVIVRSATNVEAGARTRMSVVMHGAWLLGFVSLAPFVLHLIPTASLAGVLIYAGAKLVKPTAFRQLLKFGKSEAAIYLGTILAIVATNLLEGVLIGLALAMVKLLWTLSHHEAKVEHEGEGERAVVELDGAATFLRLPKLAGALESIPPGAEVHLKLDGLGYIDPACRELIANWRDQHVATGGSLVLERHGRVIPWRQSDLADERGRVLDSETLAVVASGDDDDRDDRR
jgi:MFS superfamily sulfate permease-like transporter